MKRNFAPFLIVLAAQFSLAKTPSKGQVIEIKITEKGFQPNQVEAKPGVPITLKVTRTTDATCATQIKIPARDIKQDLPLNKTITIEIGALQKGDVRFTCGMDMVSGHILLN